MSVDPCFDVLLQDPRNELRPPPAHVTLDRLRSSNRTWLTAAPSVPLHAIDNTTLHGTAGPLPIRIYRPRPQVGPAIIYCHGGGFVLGDLDTHDSVCSRLASYSAAAVVSVEYRLAPEARFPAAVEDCYDALLAVSHHCEELGIDATRLALAGDSAGANLALAVALMVRPTSVAVRHTALLYPMVDPDCQFPSMREFGRGHLLSAAAVQWFWQQYLPSAPTADARARLLHADLKGLTSMSISTAQCDPLRDEGRALSDRARSAQVPVHYRCYEGMVHGFAGLPQMTPTADTAISDIAGDLRAALHQAPLP